MHYCCHYFYRSVLDGWHTAVAEVLVVVGNAVVVVVVACSGHVWSRRDDVADRGHSEFATAIDRCSRCNDRKKVMDYHGYLSVIRAIVYKGSA